MSREEQMLVAWCICNRADHRGQTIEQVITAPNQFHGYKESHPITDELQEVAIEVLSAWKRGEEALALEPYASTPNYMYFYGKNGHNWYREVF